nr:HAD hydrolase-like protein [Chryseolinea sp.]
MIKACIFDLDGVIVDTAHYHYLAWRRLANELGFDLSKDDNEKLKGVSRMRSLEIILNLGGVS